MQQKTNESQAELRAVFEAGFRQLPRAAAYLRVHDWVMNTGRVRFQRLPDGRVASRVNLDDKTESVWVWNGDELVQIDLREVPCEN